MLQRIGSSVKEKTILASVGYLCLQHFHARAKGMGCDLQEHACEVADSP